MGLYEGDDVTSWQNSITMSLIFQFSDDPNLIHVSNDPHTLKCSVDSQDENVWIEFMLDNSVLGYCGKFTSPVEHKHGISINYDSSKKACVLTIDKLTKKNRGNYSCSAIVLYPDGNGFLKLNSTSLTLHTSDTMTILTAVLATVGAIAIIGLGIFAFCMCKVTKVYKRVHIQCCVKCQQSGDSKKGYDSIDKQKKHANGNPPGKDEPINDNPIN